MLKRVDPVSFFRTIVFLRKRFIFSKAFSKNAFETENATDSFRFRFFRFENAFEKFQLRFLFAKTLS